MAYESIPLGFGRSVFDAVPGSRKNTTVMAGSKQSLMRSGG